MLAMPSFKKSLIVEQFQGNYLKIEVFRHFPRTADVKKSRDQCVGIRVGLQFEVHVCTARPRSRGK